MKIRVQRSPGHHWFGSPSSLSRYQGPQGSVDMQEEQRQARLLEQHLPLTRPRLARGSSGWEGSAISGTLRKAPEEGTWIPCL